MNTARIFDIDQRVCTPNGTGVVAFVDYNPRRCSLCRDNRCGRYDVSLDQAGTVTLRGCEMAPAMTYDGQKLAARAGAVDVVVQCVRLGYAYRLSIRHSGLAGFEVDELSRSYPLEHVARRAARTATALFRSGLTVQQALDLLAVFTVTA